MLEFRNVTVRRYNSRMLKEFNLTIEEGQLLGILGDNNLSKTLMLQVGAGTIRPDQGDVYLNGRSIFREYKTLSRSLGYMSDDYGFPRLLKVEEYYSMFLSLRKIYGRYQKKRIEEVFSMLELEEYAGELIRDVPEETYPFLYLGQIILQSPEWIFLDEPFLNLGPADRAKLARILLLLQEEGMSIIVNTQMYPEVKDLFTDVVVIEDGKVATTGHVYDIYENALKQRPVLMEVLDGMDHAIEVLRADTLVDRVTINGQQVLFHFNGGEREEAELLSALVSAGALIHKYSRDILNLEDIFQESRLE